MRREISRLIQKGVLSVYRRNTGGVYTASYVLYGLATKKTQAPTKNTSTNTRLRRTGGESDQRQFASVEAGRPPLVDGADVHAGYAVLRGRVLLKHWLHVPEIVVVGGGGGGSVLTW